MQPLMSCIKKREPATNVFIKTIKQPLTAMGYGICQTTRVPLLTPHHRTLYVSWVNEHQHWTLGDWRQITGPVGTIFSYFKQMRRWSLLDFLVKNPVKILHANRELLRRWTLSNDMGGVQLAHVTSGMLDISKQHRLWTSLHTICIPSWSP